MDVVPADASEHLPELAETMPLELSPAVAAGLDRVREFVRACKAQSTLRGYQSDWREFCTWASAQGLSALPAPPEHVTAYIAECASRLKRAASRGD
jgi:hypothetical protein